MAYVIAEPCIGTKDTACVDVCPVDCIHPRKDEPDHEGVKQLFINPAECIDCGACVPVCPVTAIFALEDLPEKWQSYTPVNADFYAKKVASTLYGLQTSSEFKGLRRHASACRFSFPRLTSRMDRSCLPSNSCALAAIYNGVNGYDRRQRVKIRLAGSAHWSR